jgi:hypothetical protein
MTINPLSKVGTLSPRSSDGMSVDPNGQMSVKLVGNFRWRLAVQLPKDLATARYSRRSYLLRGKESPVLAQKINAIPNRII